MAIGEIHCAISGLWRFQCAVLTSVVIASAAMPPHRKLAPPATHDGNVDREHEQAEGDHPEAQDRKEAQEAAGHEQDAEADADRLRLRQVEIAVGEANLGGHDRSFGGSSPHRHGSDAPQSALWPQGPHFLAGKALASPAVICYEARSCAALARSAPR